MPLGFDALLALRAVAISGSLNRLEKSAAAHFMFRGRSG